MTTTVDNGDHFGERAVCVPLCAASRVYRNPQWWQHESACPVRIEYLERRAEQVAEAAEHAASVTGSSEHPR